MNRYSHIVCGWYTPDYEHWAARLMDRLDDLGEPHDFVAVDKVLGGWERNTMRKPAMILEAINRHPDKVVIFLDVDCEVRGPLAPLAETRADVAMHMKAQTRPNGNSRIWARSGTVVIRPDGVAAAFVRRWDELSRSAPLGAMDQFTIGQAIVETPGLTFEQLDARYCATHKDGIEDAVIWHDSASRHMAKLPNWRRVLNRLFGSNRAAPVYAVA